MQVLYKNKGKGKNIMQPRMKEHELDPGRAAELLCVCETGRFTTISRDGYPYTIPVHFVYIDGKIYFHGRRQGHKMDNIANNSKVCFEIDALYGYIKQNAPAAACQVNSDYESVIITGDACVVEDLQEKKKVLTQIVTKYAPEMQGLPMPEKVIAVTAVVAVSIKTCTGKYYGNGGKQ